MPSVGVTLWSAISLPSLDTGEAADLIVHGYHLETGSIARFLLCTSFSLS